MYSNVPRKLGVVFVFAAVLAAGAPPAGQQLFTSRCAGCHGLDGRGGEHAPDIATSARVRSLPDADLARIVHDGIPAAGMPAFGSSFNRQQIDAVVSYLRELQGANRTPAISGDAAAGRVLFFGAARCSECHIMHGEGGFLGADLSAYGGSHSPDEIREAIVNPNKDRDPRRGGAVTVTTRSGREYTGVVRNEDNFSLQMQTANGSFVFFEKPDVARIQRLSKSIMPENYGSTLTKAQLGNLVSYLVSASAPAAAKERDEDE